MIKIIIADDHAILRAGVKKILENNSDIIVSDEASNGEELLEKFRQQHFDLAILDISMPGRGGLDTLRELKRLYPQVPVLVLSVHSEEQIAERVLKAGASGYISKEAAPTELINAINKISSGRKYISSYLAEKLANSLGLKFDRLPHEMLSDREYNVFYLIASGKTLSEIALELHLSVKTIGTYRTRIIEKMNLKSNSEMTQYAIINNLIIL